MKQLLRFTLAATLATPLIIGLPARADDAATHLALAQAAVAARDFDKALAELDQAIALEPNNISAHSGRFRMLQVKGDKPGAIKELTRLIELQPQNASALKARADLYLEIGDDKHSHEDLIAFLKMSPADREKLRAQAQAASTEAKKDSFGKTKWQRAFGLWSMLVEAAPGDASVHYERGRTLAHLIDFLDTMLNGETARKYEISQAEARKEFAAAIQIDPTFLPAYLSFEPEFGGLSEADSKTALETLERGMKANPQSAELIMAHARLRDADGFGALHADFVKEQIAAYSRAVQVEPGNANAWEGRAHWNFFADKPQAIADATRALELQPDNFKALKVRADLYNLAEDYPRSIADYDRAHALHPNDSSFAFTRFQELKYHGDPAKALEAINELLKNGSERDLYLTSRAELFLDQKNFVGALADADAILKTKPNDEKAKKLRAKIVAAQKAGG